MLCVCVILYFIIVSGMDTYTYVVCDGIVVFEILSIYGMIEQQLMATLADEKYGYPHLHISYNIHKCNGKRLQHHSENHNIGMMMYI